VQWRDFFELEMLALVSRHVTTTLAYIAAIWVLGEAAKFIVDPILAPVINWAETVIGAACILRGVIIMLWELYDVTHKKISGHRIVLAG